MANQKKVAPLTGNDLFVHMHLRERANAFHDMERAKQAIDDRWEEEGLIRVVTRNYEEADWLDYGMQQNAMVDDLDYRLMMEEAALPDEMHASQKREMRAIFRKVDQTEDKLETKARYLNKMPADQKWESEYDRRKAMTTVLSIEHYANARKWRKEKIERMRTLAWELVPQGKVRAQNAKRMLFIMLMWCEKMMKTKEVEMHGQNFSMPIYKTKGHSFTGMIELRNEVIWCLRDLGVETKQKPLVMRTLEVAVKKTDNKAHIKLIERGYKCGEPNNTSWAVFTKDMMTTENGPSKNMRAEMKEIQEFSKCVAFNYTKISEICFDFDKKGQSQDLEQNDWNAEVRANLYGM